MNEQDWFEKERLHAAAGHGNGEEVRKLIADGFPLDGFDDTGMTPLHHAAKKAHSEIMRILLDAGAHVDARDEKMAGNTPLREVAANCSYEVAKMLIDAGADPTIPGGMQITALHQAAQRKKPEGVKVYELLKRAAKKS